MWLLGALLLATAIVLSIPLSAYFTWLMDGKYCAPRPLRFLENLLDTGPQDWKQYVLALVVFSVALFVFGFVVHSLQPLAPLNPLGRGMLEPSTIFNIVASFMTKTNLQHYSGDQHLSNFSQTFFILPNMFLSASVGFCALSANIRAFRGEATVGNFFVDMSRWVTTIKAKPSRKPSSSARSRRHCAERASPPLLFGASRIARSRRSPLPI